MNFALILFYCFGAVLLAAGLAVILVRNPVHAALFLVLAFVTGAAIWVLLYAEFLAATLILVYVGAVMVLFLFVVMMLDINVDKLREGFWGNLPLAGLVGVLMAAEMVAVFVGPYGTNDVASPGVPPPGYSNSKALGAVIYTDYVFAFELAAIILLVAIVAAIAITHRRRKETKYQDPATQLAANKAGRLKIVKMAPEPPAAPAAGEGAE